MKTIEMYLNPETGVYESKEEAKPEKKIVIIGSAEETEEVKQTVLKQLKERNLEGIAIASLISKPEKETTSTESLSEIFEQLLPEMILSYQNYRHILQNLTPYRYPSERDYKSKKRSIRRETMSREQRHAAYRASNSWRRDCSNQAAKYFARRK